MRGLPALTMTIAMAVTTGAAVSAAALAASLPAAAPPAPAPARVLVVCSPGSPGTTQDAQSTMDSFARAVARSGGWADGSLAAVYHETAEAGLARLRQDDATLAMVPLPFLIRYGTDLSLKPRLEAVEESGEPEQYSLVAKKGLVSTAASLAGWELTGAPGYAEGFVRGVVLGGWGALPADTKVTFTARALAALRRAATGEKVAVLLDRKQAAALATLPFAADLEVVAKSKPIPSGFLCTVGKRLSEPEADKLTKGLLHLHETGPGRELLRTMQMARFTTLDQTALDAIRRQAAGAQ